MRRGAQQLHDAQPLGKGDAGGELEARAVAPALALVVLAPEVQQVAEVLHHLAGARLVRGGEGRRRERGSCRGFGVSGDEERGGEPVTRGGEQLVFAE